MLYLTTIDDDPADLETLVAEMRVIQSEVKYLNQKLAEEEMLRGKLEADMAEKKKLRGKLQDEMAEEKKQRGTLEEELPTERNSRVQADAALTAVNKALIRTLNEYNAHNFTEQIAFFVHSVTSFGPVTVDTNIPFPVENVNIGGGWKPSIDAFQAPIAGYYFFSAGILSVIGSTPIASIRHADGSTSSIVSSMFASGSVNNGNTKDVIIYLEVGDYVSVQLLPSNDGEVYSDNHKYTTFAGFLLYA